MSESEGSGQGSQADADETLPLAEGPSTTSTLTRPQRISIKNVTERVYRFRTKSGHDPTKVFHRKVNKRLVPDYYEVIQEPVALSTLRAKIIRKLYNNFEEFVRDAALITHNAMIYNRPEAGAYQDAITLRHIFQKEFQLLVGQKIITAECATYPDLGELPPVEDMPRPEAVRVEDEDDEEEEEEEEDEEEEESEQENAKGKGKRGPKPGLAAMRREALAASQGISAMPGSAAKKRRGRPPKVETPMEVRIKTILKASRKLKNNQGNAMVHSFERLPDKGELPDYYAEIKEPISIEQIKRKHKRKKYPTVDHFLRDMDLMFNNCKRFNLEGSQVYQDAVALQAEVHKLAARELAKPDADFALEEGRLPLPNGIMYNGSVWKIGDWVHIQNPNDVTKPIIAQIYRTWQDNDGEMWLNACWYYRPEQTIHQYEKHFYHNEVVKTGQYRDHRIDEIIDRCFVMFITRYCRGRPHGLGEGKEVYVSEARYNEDKHRFNKVKTWASCVPDEVRDQDYEMDYFEKTRKIRKYPSPLLHLLKDDLPESEAKETWGAENAPPILGAIYKGPRDENQSPPPPEHSPSPPPRGSIGMSGRMSNGLLAYNSPDVRQGDYRRYGSHSNLPVNGAASAIHAQRMPLPHHMSSAGNQVYQGSYAHGSDQHASSHNKYATGAAAASQIQTGFPRPEEVFRLPENANLAIPENVRNSFQQDDHGRVLFFTNPSIDALPDRGQGTSLGHTTQYLAAKRRRLISRSSSQLDVEPQDHILPQNENLRSADMSGKVENFEAECESSRIKSLTDQAITLLGKQLDESTVMTYKDLCGSNWMEAYRADHEDLARRQEKTRQARAQHQRKNGGKMSSQIPLTTSGMYKDDYNPRY